MAQELQFFGGAIQTAATAPGVNLRAVEVSPGSPPVMTTSPIAGGNNSSTTYEAFPDGLLVSTYNVNTDEIDLYRKLWDTSWESAASVSNCDGTYDGVHFDTTVSPHGDHAFVSCSHGSNVWVHQVDLATGGTDWSKNIQVVQSSQNAFFYYTCTLTGPLKLPDGSTGEGLACLAPDNNNTNVVVTAPIGGSSPPQYTKSVTLAGSTGDRQDIKADAKMVYVVRSDPDGTGLLAHAINFNDLTGTPSVITQEDNSINANYASFAPDLVATNTLTVTQVISVTINPHPVAVGGNGTVGVYTIDFPNSFANQEDGTLGGWDRVVGKGP